MFEQGSTAATAAAPSLLTYWREILATLTVFGGLLLFLARLAFDSQFRGAFTREKLWVKGSIDELYAPRIATVDAAVQETSANSDRLQAFEASLLRQGDSLSRQVGDHFSQSARALEGVTSVLGEMQKEIATTAKEVARISGYMEANGEWDGTTPDRRRGGRRHTDGDHA